nr:MAG TPA: hypothetical protein [Caudoviricetes sp.]
MALPNSYIAKREEKMKLTYLFDSLSSTCSWCSFSIK